MSVTISPADVASLDDDALLFELGRAFRTPGASALYYAAQAEANRRAKAPAMWDVSDRGFDRLSASTEFGRTMTVYADYGAWWLRVVTPDGELCEKEKRYTSRAGAVKGSVSAARRHGALVQPYWMADAERLAVVAAA